MTQLTRRQVLAGAAASAASLALVGCGSGSDTDKSLTKNKDAAMDKYGVGDQFKATKPVTFSIMMLSNPAYPYNKSWPFLTELKKRTNVSLDATVIPLSDYNQKRSVMVSSGNAPMIIPKTYHPDEEQYIAGGAILPVSDYLELMPNFRDKVAKWNMDPDLDTIREADGKFYLLPGLHQDVWDDYSLAVRTDVLQKLGLDVPKSWDDVTTMLRAMKAAHPGTYPFSDRYSTPPSPGANAFFQILSQAYGTQAGWVYQFPTWDASQKKFVVTGAMDQYKQMLQYMNTLVKEKLFDPESFTQQDDQAIQKFVTGKSFVISTNAQQLVSDLRKGLTLPGATVAKIPVPIGPAGNVKVGTRLENGVMISKKARDSKNFVALMQFVDWLWYSDAGESFAKWGIQGETYDGNPQTGSDFKLKSNITWGGVNPGAPKSLQVDYGFYNGVFAYGGSTKFLDTQFSSEEQQFQDAMNGRKTQPVAPPFPLTADEREQVSLWDSSLKDYIGQQSLKFALGQRSFDQWDQYVSELKGKNSEQYLDVVNKAYQRFEKKK